MTDFEALRVDEMLKDSVSVYVVDGETVNERENENS